jgi:hypothetical protein
MIWHLSFYTSGFFCFISFKLKFLAFPSLSLVFPSLWTLINVLLLLPFVATFVHQFSEIALLPPTYLLFQFSLLFCTLGFSLFPLPSCFTSAFRCFHSLPLSLFTSLSSSLSAIATYLLSVSLSSGGYVTAACLRLVRSIQLGDRA